MSNSNGGPLRYPDIHFTGTAATLISENLHIRFRDILIDYSGNISGNCVIRDVVIGGGGMITGSDTIRNVFIHGDGRIEGEESVINLVDFGSTGKLIGRNHVKKVICRAEGLIRKSNTVDTALFSDYATVYGSNNIQYLRILRKAIIDSSNDIYTADLMGDGFLGGNNRFHYLNFTPGFTYTFGIDQTQTVYDEWNITGNCNAPVRLLSDTNGVQAVIKVTGSPVNGAYLSIRDLKAVGNTPFRAAHSVDLGNNSNWDIETTSGLDLYWVNGSGNWSDNYHWDTQSGGSGGHCPPTEIDNAFFDGNSFNAANQKVTVDAENAVCRDMIWKNAVNAPQLSGADTNNLHIYGSLREAPSLNWQLTGNVYFDAVTPGQTILTQNHYFIGDTWFTGRGGSWDFKDSFKTKKSIFFQQGKINTLANDVECFNFSSTDTTTRELRLGTTTWEMTGVGILVWNLNAVNLTLHADSSLLISRGGSGHILSFGSGTPLRYNNVVFYGNGSQLENGLYCYYNVIDHYGMGGMFRGNCSIDSALFHNENGLILDNDSIHVAIFDMKNGEIRGGVHHVQLAVFKDDGIINGNNFVDTALFYRNGSFLGTNTVDTAIVYNRARINGSNTFRTATLLGDGQFIGDNTFNDLTITKSNSYFLEHDKTQTVIDHFNAHGTCTGPLFIQSDEDTKQAIIKKVNGSVEVDYLQLRDIKAEGQAAPFVAYNSVDLGNNINWNIYVSSPKELYWVGGKGVWSDSLHWSETSGGQGGYCIPTPIDNVYFDGNSFLDLNDSVVINIGNATCHNMNWTGAKFNPVFYSPDTNFMRIYGGLILNKDMDMALECPVVFESTHDNNHIRCKTTAIKSNIYFLGIGGEWLLDDDFISLKTVFFKHGKLNSLGHNIKTGSFNTNYTTARVLKVDSSTIYLTGGGSEVWFLNGLNMELSAKGTVFEMSSANAIFRTDLGGPFEYYVVKGVLVSWVFNKNTSVSFEKISFNSSGQVHGNCTVDTLVSKGDLSVFDSDKINFIKTSEGKLLLQGGSHKVNTMIAGGEGIISGNNVVGVAVINGAGVLSGTNSITESIVFGDVATISGSNFANYALLKNNGTFNGENEFDSLKFMPGNIYELEEDKTQTVNEDFFIRGNNCFPITLRSQYDGRQAVISMPSGRTVSGDFIEIKDINALGGAVYYAGQYSTNLSNNSGWNFNNAPGYIFGFNDDTVACLGGSSVIGTENFNPDENSTFLWQDGSTDSYFQLNGEDTLWVTVNYADNCSFTDTVAIHYKPSPQVDLGNDLTICSGDTVYVKYHSDSVTFLWDNGSDDSVCVVTQSGYCAITVTNSGGCSATDSVYITALPAPEVNLGPDTVIYSNQNYLLDAGNTGADYIWSTGDTMQSITINSEGDYWVAVSANGCSGYDTVSISVYPDCILAVPNAFSPNGDGHNDILFARGEGFVEMELMIFNRIGELVFDTKDIGTGWDGTFKGKKQPVDAYTYMLRGVCVSGNSVFKKGNITLLR